MTPERRVGPGRGWGPGQWECWMPAATSPHRNQTIASIQRRNVGGNRMHGAPRPAVNPVRARGGAFPGARSIAGHAQYVTRGTEHPSLPRTMRSTLVCQIYFPLDILVAPLVLPSFFPHSHHLITIDSYISQDHIFSLQFK